MLRLTKVNNPRRQPERTERSTRQQSQTRQPQFRDLKSKERSLNCLRLSDIQRTERWRWALALPPPLRWIPRLSTPLQRRCTVTQMIGSPTLLGSLPAFRSGPLATALLRLALLLAKLRPATTTTTSHRPRNLAGCLAPLLWPHQHHLKRSALQP